MSRLINIPPNTVIYDLRIIRRKDQNVHLFRDLASIPILPGHRKGKDPVKGDFKPADIAQDQPLITAYVRSHLVFDTINADRTSVVMRSNPYYVHEADSELNDDNDLFDQVFGDIAFIDPF